MTDSFPLPDIIADRYKVERELGGGGMSSVYLADDLKHGRKVAVKVMRQDRVPSFGPNRFTREIELTARLTHPHILPLLDSGEMEGCAYYVMPFIEGESLRDLLGRDRRLSLNDALHIAREVADALAYAHANEVVHRDIKPENILLSAGHAVVADFGIARALTAAVDGTVTMAGIAIGTPTYMSPEQSLGEDVDGRTDIYSLGCVLFEMLTGEVPFHAATAIAMLARKITAVAPNISSLREAVPAEVEVLVKRALSREPEGRFQTAREFIEALDTARAGGMPIAVTMSAPHNTVAVLPFLSRGEGADDDYLGDGIAEELMHALTALGGLRVIARTSAFAFRNSGLDVKEIGRRLNVRRIVEGSVRRSGNRLRVSAKLIDAETAFEIWSERFDRQVDDLFVIEDEIAAAIAHSLKQLLMSESGQRLRTRTPFHMAPTTNFGAYEQYLKGRHFWGMRNEDGLRRSIDHLENALEIDPNFALAYAALADTLATMGLYGMAAPREVMPLAREAAEHALELDSSLAEALTARACVRAIYDWDWVGAEQDFKLAIATNPQYPTAHQWLAMHCLVPLGRFDEARLALVRARELDPLSLSISVSVAAVDYYERHFEDAIVSSTEVLALDERFVMGHYFLGLALEQEGRTTEALGALDRAAQLSTSSEVSAAVAHARAAAGDSSGASVILDQLETRATTRYESPVLLAQIEVGQGRLVHALARLHAAQELRSADLMWLAVRPTFDPLRSHPEFGRLLESLRLPPLKLAHHPTENAEKLDESPH
ncbi:MAG: protein kinase [bacterium]